MSLVAAFSLSPPDIIVDLTSSQREDCRGSTVPKEEERDGETKEREIEGEGQREVIAGPSC